MPSALMFDRVLEHRGVGRIGADDLLAALQERRAHDLQHFAGSGGQQDVLGLHAVVLGNRLDDAAVRIAIAVRVFPRAVHGLHDGLGRAPVVLVARQLGEAVVVSVGAAKLCRAALREQRLGRGPEAQDAHGCGDPSKKAATR